MSDSAINTAVLYADYTTRLSYYDDWLDAFKDSPLFSVQAFNICDRSCHDRIARLAGEADAIILLHSTNGDTAEYMAPLEGLLCERRGKLLSFVGNEVNLPGSSITEKRRLFSRIAPDIIATQLLPEAGEFLFGDLARERVVSIPHALNPEAFRPTTDDSGRPIDIGVRAVRYLAHLGDDDRNRLFEFFGGREFTPPLKVDIRTERLDRKGWAAFLNRCKGTVSTEAGSWYLEKDDHTVEDIRRWTAAKGPHRIVVSNDSRLRRLGHKLPWQMRVILKKLMSKGPIRHESTITEELPYDEVFKRFFRDYPKPRFYGKCISSRHFDAIGTKTCQIMFPGRYNDILKADVHYISLQPDFSNADDVLDRFRDDRYRESIVERAYEFVRANHTYSHRTETVYSVLQ